MSEHETDARPGRGNRPIETLRDGALKLSIFRNSGERGFNYTAVPGRIYTDEKTNKVRETSSLSGGELLRMANLHTRGYERIAYYRERDKEGQSRERDERPRNERSFTERLSRRGRARSDDHDRERD